MLINSEHRRGVRRFTAEVRKTDDFGQACHQPNFKRTPALLTFPGRSSTVGDGDFIMAGTLTNQTRTGMFQSENMDEIVERFPLLPPHFRRGCAPMAIPLSLPERGDRWVAFPVEKTERLHRAGSSVSRRGWGQIAGAHRRCAALSRSQGNGNVAARKEPRFRAPFEQWEAGVAEIDMNTGRFLTENRRLCEIIGRTKEELSTPPSRRSRIPRIFKCTWKNTNDAGRGDRPL